jgi:hypothetical protein
MTGLHEGSAVAAAATFAAALVALAFLPSRARSARSELDSEPVGIVTAAHSPASAVPANRG